MTAQAPNNMAKLKKGAVTVIALAFGVFHLYVALFGALDPYRQRQCHLLFAMVLVLLLKPANHKKPRSAAGYACTVLVGVCTVVPLGYMLYNYATLLRRMPYVQQLKPFQYVLAVMLVVALLESTRRSLGLALPIVAMAALSYALFGQHMPGLVRHQGFSLLELTDLLVYTTDGIFGIALGTSATFVILFILFGAFLEQSGVADYFMDLARVLTAGSKGGPAKMAVIASALFGSISGSAIANVATTGQITIPLMKKTGYRPEFAGAVEAVASTGGQIMPPVMGAAVFVMCDFTGIPYAQILKCAIFPALLYYAAVFFMVHFEAVKAGIGSGENENLPSKKELLLTSYMLLPLVSIVVMLMLGYSATYACLFGILMTVVTSWFKKKTRMGIRKICTALIEGAKGSTSVAVTCATAGIVVGVVNYSGLALKFTSLLLQLGRQNLLLVLFLTAVATIILGMGLPTTPAYIVVASLMVPTIIRMEVPVIAAHLFAFYFATVANITPPVALASYTAAGLADSEPMKTGFIGFRLGIVAFIVPFMFVYNTNLLLLGDNMGELLLAVATASIGVVFLAAASGGWFISRTTRVEQLLLLIASLTLIHPGLITDLIGIGIGGAVILRQAVKKRKTL